MKKKIFIVTLACVLACVSSFGATYAYLIARDEALNKFTIGETEVEITEEYTPPPKLEPGIEFTKKPMVTNTGNLPCYVRMRADFSTSVAETFCEPLDIDTVNWQYNNTDGYYYYTKLLYPGEKTESLFTTVTLKETKDDGTAYTEADLVEFEILVYAEATQHTDHNGDCAADEYLAIW